MQRDAILKEHEVRKRDLLIVKYDKQRTLCDEIIDRQRELIEGKKSRTFILIDTTLHLKIKKLLI